MIEATSMPPLSPRLRVCAVLTSFNRREHTLSALRALGASSGMENVDLRALLVDDGSTDGTRAAVEAEFPWVTVDSGDGSLFWCRGMHRAIELASHAGHDHYLWLNDDTLLRPDALRRLIACHDTLRQAASRPVLLVGSTVDAVTGEVSYGGENQHSWIRATRFDRVLPTEAPQACGSMTGNIVLMSAEVLACVGNLDARYEHAMGDTDFALRAGRRGVQLYLAPGVYGTCSDNPPSGTYRDRSLPLARRWRLIQQRKGLPWRSWWLFTRRHAGPLWPLHFAWPYARLVLDAVSRRGKGTGRHASGGA